MACMTSTDEVDRGMSTAIKDTTSDGETHRDPSRALDDIVTELRLEHDASMGLLEGEAVHAVPSVNTLMNLNKLLTTLAKELSIVESTDIQVLKMLGDPAQTEPIHAEGLEIEVDNSIKVEDDPDIEVAPVTQPQVPLKGVSKRPAESSDSVSGDAKRQKMNTGDIVPGTALDSNLPPVQSGSYTQDNDTRLKNPKSEFVSSQELSVAAITELGLYSEEQDGLETQGTEYLKRKYGVASYPDRDLLDMLPGPIPDVDLSKVKAPNNQVQFSTFQTYTEQFFRQFTVEDLGFLQERDIIPPGIDLKQYDPEVTPFIIPKLGPLYSQVWAQEDAALGAKISLTPYHQPLDLYRPKGSADMINDEKIYTEQVLCGPLSSRLISALLGQYEVKAGDRQEHVADDDEDKIVDFKQEEDVATKLDNEEEYKVAEEVNDFPTLEQRLKRELKFIGIFKNLPNNNGQSAKLEGSIIDNDDWIGGMEDDEVCAEMRLLQSELRKVTARNRDHRKKLLPVVEEQMAYQEYCLVLEDLDKQVDQAYMKRLKGKSKKKKDDSGVAAPIAPLNSGLRSLLDKRQRWIDHVGKLFKSAETMKRVPTLSILSAPDEESKEFDDQ